MMLLFTTNPQVWLISKIPKEETITALLGGIIATDVEKFHLHLHLQDKTQNATLR